MIARRGWAVRQSDRREVLGGAFNTISRQWGLPARGTVIVYLVSGVIAILSCAPMTQLSAARRDVSQAVCHVQPTIYTHSFVLLYIMCAASLRAAAPAGATPDSDLQRYCCSIDPHVLLRCDAVQGRILAAYERGFTRTLRPTPRRWCATSTAWTLRAAMTATPTCSWSGSTSTSTRQAAAAMCPAPSSWIWCALACRSYKVIVVCNGHCPLAPRQLLSNPAVREYQA